VYGCSPERLAFVLHDMCAAPFEEIPPNLAVLTEGAPGPS
jgi:hypothetical protein